MAVRHEAQLVLGDAIDNVRCPAKQPPRRRPELRGIVVVSWYVLAKPPELHAISEGLGAACIDKDACSSMEGAGQCVEPAAVYDPLWEPRCSTRNFDPRVVGLRDSLEVVQRPAEDDDGRRALSVPSCGQPAIEPVRAMCSADVRFLDRVQGTAPHKTSCWNGCGISRFSALAVPPEAAAGTIRAAWAARVEDIVHCPITHWLPRHMER
mmetsp:Transcript_5852/g.15957  ORF Transcript_5852/g.15957 Transcript_5852/m.15957 type:complete len:209 (+) Transcript_5852:614-1240(+)